MFSVSNMDLKNECQEGLPKEFQSAITHELPGAPPPGPLPGALPLDPTGALERAPGPHTVKARALCALELTLRVRNYF